MKCFAQHFFDCMSWEINFLRYFFLLSLFLSLAVKALSFKHYICFYCRMCIRWAINENCRGKESMEARFLLACNDDCECISNEEMCMITLPELNFDCRLFSKNILLIGKIQREKCSNLEVWEREGFGGWKKTVNFNQHIAITLHWKRNSISANRK